MKTLLLLLIPVLSFSQTRFFTTEDFRGSKMRGFNLGAVLTFPQLKAKDIPAMKAMGANHGRAWVQINHASGSSQYYWCDYKGNKVPSPLPVIDSLLKIARANNFYIILTVEIFPHQAQTDWWGNSTLKSAITKFWIDSLVKRYKSEKIIAAYDLMNEPRVKTGCTTCTVKEYIQFQYDMFRAIQAVDSNHVLVLEVLRNQMLGDVALRKDSTFFKSTLLTLKNWIASPHGYSPLRITNQGAISDYYIPQPYPNYTYKEKDGTMYTEDYFGNVTYWAEPAAFTKKYNIPVWVGEFSCINWAPKNKYGEWTSTRWVKDVITYMEKVGFSWAYHARREYQGWEADLPSAWYYDPANGVTFTNGKPSKLPPTSARTITAPTYKVLDSAFDKNVQIQ